MTHDTWHVTPNMGHMTHDTSWEVKILSKFQLPSYYSYGVMMFWRFGGKESVNELNK